jgi:hypothetical protein
LPIHVPSGWTRSLREADGPLQFVVA